MKYDDSQKLSESNYPDQMMFVCKTEDEVKTVLNFVKSIGWDTEDALNVRCFEWSEFQTNLHCYNDKSCGFFEDVEDDHHMEGVPKFTVDSIFTKESKMYINKHTHEMSGEKIRGIGWIEVPDGATFATGTTFDGDFVWRKDGYYLDANYLKSEHWKPTDVTLETQRDFYKLNMLWIHPNIKQKMLKGEIPNQVTEKEWMRFDYSKLVGCVVNCWGEDIVIKGVFKLTHSVGGDMVYFSGSSLGVVGEYRDKLLNNCYFYLEDGTMVGFDEYKGVYYND